MHQKSALDAANFGIPEVALRPSDKDAWETAKSNNSHQVGDEVASLYQNIYLV